MESAGTAARVREAHDIVRRAGWLTQVPEVFRERVLQRCRLRSYPSSDMVFRVGDPPGGIYGLVSGSLEVSVAPERQGPYTIHLAGPGFWIGEAPIFTRGPRIAGLRATRETRMLHLPLGEIEQILREDHNNWRWFGLLAIEHIRILLGIIDDLVIRNAEQRCIAVLLRISGFRPLFDSKDPLHPVDVTHDALAGMVNLSRNSVGGILRKLENRGLIALQYGQIRVLDPNALDAMIDDL